MGTRKAPAQKRIKTSVSMPIRSCNAFFTRRVMLRQRMGNCLRELRRLKPRRDRSRIYNLGQGKTAHVNVYWTIEEYNKLHHVASVLRVSVSYLIFMMLEVLERITTEQQVFSNCVFICHEWSTMRLAVAEDLFFLPRNRCKRERNSLDGPD
jgi:hypothetical protein